MPKRIGAQWIDRGVLMVETQRGPDVFRGTCDACDLPACWVDGHDGTRACYTHTHREAMIARERRAERMARLLSLSSGEVRK